MTIAIIDYGSGNLHSAVKAFERVRHDTALRHSITLTTDPDLLRDASHIVLPGVGAFADCIAGLKRIDGMVNALNECVLTQQKPFLGICVGMQMMLEQSLEYGTHAGLGWIAGKVMPITPADASLKIPHMGWNNLNIMNKSHMLLRNIAEGDHAYFVHSFHAQCDHPDHCLATVDYGGSVSACIGKDNMLGTQFHPEKSQRTGLQLIENFMRMT